MDLPLMIGINNYIWMGNFLRSISPFSDSTMETVNISDEIVNPSNEKIGPESFELLKVLGKGGYGKVCVHFNVSILIYRYFYQCLVGKNLVVPTLMKLPWSTIPFQILMVSIYD